MTSILLLIALTLTSSGIAADLHRAQHVHADQQTQPDASETGDCHCNHDHGKPAATDATVASHFDANHHADDHCQTCINLHARAIQPSTPAADHSIADAGVAPCPFEAQVHHVPTTLQIDCTGPPGW